MTQPTETNSTFTNLAQVMAANDTSFKGLSDFVLSPLADALAKIGIAPTRPQILSILSRKTSLAIRTGLETNAKVGQLVPQSGTKIATNDTTFQQAA